MKPWTAPGKVSNKEGHAAMVGLLQDVARTENASSKTWSTPEDGQSHRQLGTSTPVRYPHPKWPTELGWPEPEMPTIKQWLHSEAKSSIWPHTGGQNGQPPGKQVAGFG